MVTAQRRFGTAADAGPPRVDFGVVTRIGSVLEIGIPVEQTRVRSLEEWVRDNVIGSLPGACDAAE